MMIKDIISSGKFVSDQIITSLLEKRLMKEDCNNGQCILRFIILCQQHIDLLTVEL